MKYLVALIISALATGALSLTDEQKQTQDTIAIQCLHKSGADPKVVTDLKSGAFLTNDEKTQCFVKCIFEEAGILDSEGNVNETVAKDILTQSDDKDKVERTIDECKNLRGETVGETALKLYECYYAKTTNGSTTTPLP